MADKKKSQEGKASAGKQSPQEAGQFAMQLPVEWHYDPGIVSRYTNNLMVQVGQRECYLSFFELRPPVLAGSQEDIERQAKEIKSVRAECVARVVMAHELLPSIIQALQNVWEKKLSAQSVEASEAGENNKKKASEL